MASETLENAEATAEETTTKENKVSEITSEAPIATEAVEATQAPVVTAQYVAYTKPRVNENVTAGQYAAAQIRAIQGDTDARDLIEFENRQGIFSSATTLGTGAELGLGIWSPDQRNHDPAGR